MIGMNYRLAELEKSGRVIKVGLIGAGQMGLALTSQLTAAPGMMPAVLSDHTLDKARRAFVRAGKKENEDFFAADTVDEAEKIISAGKSVITTNNDLAIKTPSIDIVADATGVPSAGAEIACAAIENGKHIIMLDVETDVCIGPTLWEMANKKGVVYTGMAGDEPGAVMELYDFAKTAGFDVRVIGKGKNNSIDYTCNPDSVRDLAKEKGCSPRMLASFVDGTKTMVEMTAMANATGFLPDVPGGHGVEGMVPELPKLLSLESEGGILHSYGVVEYVRGIAPGVFAIISSPMPEVRETLRYISMGDGPNYILYRPYHLTSPETPVSIARAVLDHTPTIAPRAGQVAETVTAAKRDLAPGEVLDGIGGYMVRGVIMSHADAKAKNLLPMGLSGCAVRMKRSVAAGEYVSWDDVELDESLLLVKLRREQDKRM